MTEKEIEQLRDLQGFMDWCIAHEKEQSYCLSNICHDCGLLLAGRDDGSLPRTSGYAKFRDKQ